MKMVLVVVRPKMAKDFSSKELEPINDEGAVHDSHWTDLGLLKKVWIACWIKMVHVKIALIQWLEICMENVC